MPFRHLIKIPRNALRLVLFVVVVGVITFFALTRTQLGRDGLRNQLVQQFNEALPADLEIGRLTGNLINTLYATDVRLLDPEGDVLMSVDSMVIEHRWQDLFRRRIAIRRLTLVQPVVNLVRRDDGSWNAAHLLNTPPRPDSLQTDARWTFASAEVRITGGIVTTSRTGPPPAAVARGAVFDYTNAFLYDLDGLATIDWLPSRRQVDVIYLSARLHEPAMELAGLQGQFVLEDDRLALNELFVDAGATTLQLNGAVGGIAALRQGDYRSATFSLALQPSTIDNDDVRRLWPAFPLADALDVTARLRGPLDGLVLESFSARRGRSRFQAEGVFVGLPDSLNYEVALRNNVLTNTDVRAVLPMLAPWPQYNLDSLGVDVYARGVMPVRAAGSGVRGRAEVTLGGPPGAVAAELSWSRPDTAALQYEATVNARGVDLQRVLPALTWRSRINGRIDVQGTGLQRGARAATAQLRLSDTMLADRVFDSLRVDVTASPGRVATVAAIRQGTGRLTLDGRLDLTAALPQYQLAARADGLDLGPLLRNDSLATHLNAGVELAGRGTIGPALQGTVHVTFDTSTVRLRDQERGIAAHRSMLTLYPRSTASPRLSLTGDLATFHLGGDVDLRQMAALGQLWRQAFAEAIRSEMRKPYRSMPALADAPDAGRTDRLRTAAARSLATVQREALTLTADLDLHRSDILFSLLPALPIVHTGLQAHLELTAGADAFTLAARLGGDTLAVGTFRADTLTARLEAGGTLNAPLERTLMLALDARAHTLYRGSQFLPAPRLALDYGDQNARLTLTADERDRVGPLRLSAALALLPDRNRLTLNDFLLSSGDYTWTQTGHPSVDLYANAVVIPGLGLENRTPGAEALQRIQVQGVYSKALQDTLFVDAEDIGLHPISQLAAMRLPLGGLLNGRVALTGAAQRPEVTGQLTVSTLTLDNRVLGDLRVSSSVLPGLPDVALELELTPVPEARAAAPLPGLDAAPVVEPSSLRLDGSFRLPQFGDDGALLIPSNLNFLLQIDRADLFFFDYLFQKVRNSGGYITGNGTIRGTLGKPILEAQLQAREASMDFPNFNLHVEANGALHVDEVGIHIDTLQVVDPTNGTASINGRVLFNDYRFISYDLAGTLRDLQIMNIAQSDTLPFYGHIWASGDATLTGPLNNALLRSVNTVTSSQSEVFFPITEDEGTSDTGFIIFADSTGALPDLDAYTRRANILSRRAAGERTFSEGLDMDLNIVVPSGSTIHLVFDPLLGDVINAEGSGRIQLQRTGGEYTMFGGLTVDSGDYLFIAGEVFVRRFFLEPGGTIIWDGNPINAQLNLPAQYRTRASAAGLPNTPANNASALIPLIVNLQISGRVVAPQVTLSLSLDRSDLTLFGENQAIQAQLNQPERATEYATSVLLTNSFRLTTDNLNPSNSGSQLAFTSVSQLVSSQLNRFLNNALPNVDFTFGVQGEKAQDLDVTYGVALRLLDQRLIIRGQGVYQGSRATASETATENLQGEFVVEVRLNPNISVEVFYRRESDFLAENAALTNTAGAGLSYQTEFTTWRTLFRRFFGWLFPARHRADPEAVPDERVATTEANPPR